MRCAPAWPTSSEADFSKRTALDAWVAHVLAVVEGLTAIPNVVMLVRTAESGTSVQESRLLVACCVSSILSKVRVVVACQRCH